MAERRMFSKKIIDTDAFLDMPLSAQALYFHLSMRADDDGFVSSPRKIRAMVGASEDDLKLLILKRFVLTFDSGVVVIKHWRIHNYISPDRYKPTTYVEELSTLGLDGKKAYVELDNNVVQNVVQNVDNPYTQVSIVKSNREKEESKEEKEGEKSPSRSPFIKPTVAEIEAYVKEKGYNIDAQRFFDFYESKGWLVGKSKMKNWQAAVRTWVRREGGQPAQSKSLPSRREWYLQRKESAEIRASRSLERAMQDEVFKTASNRTKQLSCEIAFCKTAEEEQQKEAELNKQEQVYKLRLMELGLDIEPRYGCLKCKDTGYLPNGKACDCYDKEFGL